ncbi:MAG: DNA-binding protein WhiA [Clostridiaceae bacterium]|nr:DNA-binding protein WhiA [Clostridiaceae bacterium]
MNMTFAAKVKNEICMQEIDSICCIRAQLAGMVSFAAYIKNNSIIIKTENINVSHQFSRLVKRLYNLNTEQTSDSGGVYNVGIFGMEALKILRDIMLASIPIKIDERIILGECCKRSFIQGAFLAAGSISAPEKGYHAEFVANRYGVGEGFCKCLYNFAIHAKSTNRKGKYVFYIKNSGHIENLLAVLGAHTQMMGLLNIKIEKELRNSTNRLVNCENANSEKTAEAAVAQIQAIKTLDKKFGLDNLPPHLMAVAKMRLKNPEATLSDIALDLGITKSGINHRMRRIMQISKEKTEI